MFLVFHLNYAKCASCLSYLIGVILVQQWRQTGCATDIISNVQVISLGVVENELSCSVAACSNMQEFWSLNGWLILVLKNKSEEPRPKTTQPRFCPTCAILLLYTATGLPLCFILMLFCLHWLADCNPIECNQCSTKSLKRD